MSKSLKSRLSALEQANRDAEVDANHARLEQLVRRIGSLMGWEYSTTLKYTCIRKIAVGEAAVIGLDKLEAICTEIERLRKEVESAEGSDWMTM